VRNARRVQGRRLKELRCPENAEVGNGKVKSQERKGKAKETMETRGRSVGRGRSTHTHAGTLSR
jgi:hypothetical protein